MAGDYYASSKENPANRAKVTPNIFGQILSALVSFGQDIVTPKKYQDRGSAQPFSTDILVLNSPTTPPAASQSNIAENSEERNSHQYNEPQFRFVRIGTLTTLSNQPVPLFVRIPPREGAISIVKERFRAFHSLVGESGGGRGTSSQIVFHRVPDGKKIIETAQQTPEGSGSASASSGGTSSGTSGGGTSGGFSGGGRTRISAL